MQGRRRTDLSRTVGASRSRIVSNANIAQQRVVVIGGGISGLAAAHRLRELKPDCEIVLIEAGNRLGGVLDTVRRDGFLIEQSADNFITNVPWGVELCRRVGLGDALVTTSSEHRGALVVHRGKLARVPAGFVLMAPSRVGSVLTTPILSPWGKLRLLGEYFVPRRTDDRDESLASFARRRLGRQAFERIVQPLVGGIYTADPEKLSLRATLPRFLEMERRFGGLIRGAMRQTTGASESESGARYGMFVAPRDGMASLVAAIAERLPAGCVRLNERVESVARNSDGTWSVTFSPSPLMGEGRGEGVGDRTVGSVPGLTPQARQGAEVTAGSRETFHGVILATPANVAARIARELDPQLSTELGRIEYAGTAIVTLGYQRDQIDHALDGFGFVVPAIEKRQILAGSFSSVKFAGRAPEGRVLVRVFIGGACQSELTRLGDDELRRIAHDELTSLLSIHGAPQFADVIRWPSAMPQYHLGHVELIESIEQAVARWPGLELAGNAYHGVGIPNCIHSGETAAERVAQALSSNG